MEKITTKQRLAKDAARASRIQQVLSENGWRDILEIIQSKYDSLMNDLLEKENAEARGGINTIIEIMNDISRDIDFGEAARKKYADRYLKQTT